MDTNKSFAEHEDTNSRQKPLNNKCEAQSLSMSDARSHPHTVYLIRHGETVDNLAGVYAGVTNSALTNHGVLQGERLGQYFARQGVVFTHFYASDLSRAKRTAENIRKFQVTGDDAPAIVVCPDLQEQDFGFYEGRTFYARSPDSKKTGKALHRAAHQNEEGFQDIETKESMAKRADSYLDEHLISVLQGAPSDHQYIVCIVSHGIMLSSLWKAILRRQLPNTVTLDQEAIIAGKPLALEHLGGFSNTGYLRLEFEKREDNVKSQVANTETPLAEAVISSELPSYAKDTVAEASADDNALSDVQTVLDSAATSLPTDLPEVREGPKSTKDVKFRILVKVINGKEHLKGLKRTGGGVGSSMYDEGQKSIETFFKKRRTRS